MLDLEALLKPVSDDAPCGPDLEYDPAWQELERLAQGKPEQQFGDTIIAAEEPDWREVAKRAEALLGRSKDVRSACLLARAQTHLEQFAGLGSGLQLIHQLMERYWDTVHPQLDASDNNDPTMRLNALAALADPQGLLRGARGARLSQSRALGDLTLRQIELAAGKLTPREGETAPGLAQVDQQVAAMVAQDAGLAATVNGALSAARAIAKLLDDKVGSDLSPDLKPLIASLATADQVVARAAGGQQAAAEDGASAGSATGGATGPSINASGAIRSRADVVALLDRICEFLQRTEPTNPAPLLLQRAKRLMDMGFIEIMNDLAPDGLSQARNVTGVKESDD